MSIRRGGPERARRVRVAWMAFTSRSVLERSARQMGKSTKTPLHLLVIGTACRKIVVIREFAFRSRPSNFLLLSAYFA